MTVNCAARLIALAWSAARPVDSFSIFTFREIIMPTIDVIATRKERERERERERETFNLSRSYVFP